MAGRSVATRLDEERMLHPFRIHAILKACVLEWDSTQKDALMSLCIESLY